MSDNTTLNPGVSGDIIRTVDKTPATGAKVQAFVLDAGGGDGQPESLVSAGNPLPVSSIQAAAAQTQDAPLFVAITGDPNGDYAGLNLVEQLLDPASGLALNTNPTLALKVDATKALVLSDGLVIPFSVPTVGTNGAAKVLIDAAGYASFEVNLVSGTLNIQGSNDGVNFSSISMLSCTNSTVSGVGIGANSYVAPVAYRYIALANGATAGNANNIGTVVLKQGAFSPYAANSGLGITNLSHFAGSATAATGLPIAGNVAVGSAPTANPPPLAWDGANTRRILTDTVSGGVVLGASSQGNGQTLGTLISALTPAATSVKGSAGRLYMMHVGNPNAAAVYLKLFNNSSVTLGTTSATLNFFIPAASSVGIPIGDGGLYFSNAIQFAVTGAAALNDNTAITTGCEVNYSFI